MVGFVSWESNTHFSVQAHWHNPEEEANFLLVEKVIQTVRNLKMTYQLINLRLPGKQKGSLPPRGSPDLTAQ